MKRLDADYAAALAKFLASPEHDEEALEQAYELGRRALELGAGVLELTAAHARALTGLKDPRAIRATQFLNEALAPYEMALRGYREANAALQKLTASLEERVRAATAELREAEAKFRGLVEQLPAVVYLTPLAEPGNMTYVSPQIERLTGYTPVEWLGGPRWAGCIHPEDRERVLQEWAKAGPRSGLEYRLVGRAGKVAWVRDDAAAVAGRYRQGILLDLTERRHLEEQFRQSQKMEVVGLLAGGVAHDFNNLLTVILSCADLVLAGLEPGHAALEDVKEIVAAGERAASLTRQLLALGRRQVIAPEPLSLNAVVANTEKMLRRLIGENIDLEVQLPPTTRSIRADRGQIEQVILNLVVNARDAMPDGGRLTIETADAELDGTVPGAMGVAPGRYVMLAVSDTGSGMNEQTRARIFEPFFTTKPAGKGTGLGLSTVFGIVKENAGELYVYSALKLGTTFRVYLPAVTETVDAATDAEAPLSGTETLLLVDDEQSVRSVAARVLSAAGYRILEAASPDDALALSQRHPGAIDLVVTDIVMPQMNGQELADRLCRDRPSLRLLFMSGYTGGALARQRLLEPGRACVQKPFTPAALLKKVRTVLDSGRKVN